MTTGHTMTRRTQSSDRQGAFERSYLTALRGHVSSGKASQAGARIGRRALSLGVGTLLLARIHERSAAALAPAAWRAPAASEREASFFVEAVAPIEEAHCGAREALAESARLAGLLGRRTGELAATRARLAAEAEARRAAKHELLESERGKGELLERARLMEDRLRRVSHRLVTAHEEERIRISRDLHDAIGQSLTGINAGLATLKNDAANDSRALAETISLTQELVERSMRGVHQFAWELRPTLLDDLGLVPALRSYCKAFGERTGIRVRFTAAVEFERLDGDRGIAVFRVAQGALLNIERHARAGHASVRLLALPGAVRLEVRDDGRAFDARRIDRAKPGKHLGLIVMRERVEMVGGSFAVESVPGRGTMVRADVPLEGLDHG